MPAPLAASGGPEALALHGAAFGTSSPPGSVGVRLREQDCPIAWMRPDPCVVLILWEDRGWLLRHRLRESARK